jgi:hypothetical protein
MVGSESCDDKREDHAKPKTYHEVVAARVGHCPAKLILKLK